VLSDVECEQQRFVISSVLTVGTDPPQIGAFLLRDEEDPLLGHMLDQVVNELRAGIATVVDYYGTTLWFAGDVEPQTARDFVSSVARTYEERSRDRRRGLAEVQTAENRLATQLEDAIRIAPITSELPADGPRIDQ
jgi:hypothetical protein